MSLKLVASPLDVTPTGNEDGTRSGRDLMAVVRRSGPVLLGLGAIGFTQPLLDLYGRNGEVLASARLGTTQIVLWLLVVAFGIPLTLLAAELVVAVAAPRLWPLARRLATLVAASAVVLVVVRSVGIDRTVPVALVTSMGAIGITLALERAAPVRTFASYLGLANVAFIGLFLLADGGDLLGSGTQGAVVLPVGEYPPIVVVVFDEFPLTLIVDEDGTINEERFPEMAALADRSTWFRNASSPSQFTTWAVPALMTGRLVGDGQLPVVQDHPRSIYTLLGGQYAVRNYSVAVQICPDNICAEEQGRGGGGGLRTALQDAAVVWGHRALPPILSDRLPRTDQRLGGFTGDGGGDRGSDGDGSVGSGSASDPDAVRARVWDSIPTGEREPEGQVAMFRELIEGIEPGPNLLVAHMALPHWPWRLTPYGFSISTSHDHEVRYVDEDVPGRDFVINQAYQRAMLQAGMADKLVGELVDTLEAKGMWDDTLLIITSDHGNSQLGPHIGRIAKADATNVEEMLRVPLFIKAPGQSEGALRDENARTIDVLPSIVDMLELDLELDADWSFDGHSLFDGSPFPEENVVVNADVDRMSTEVSELFELARRHGEWYSDDRSWDGLAKVGPLGPLVGSDVSTLDVAESGDATWTLDQAAELSDLDRSAGWVPLVVTGVLWPDPDVEAPEYGLVAVNGTVAGVAGAFLTTTIDGRIGYQFSSLLSDRLVDGRNRVELLLPGPGEAGDGETVSFVRPALEG